MENLYLDIILLAMLAGFVLFRLWMTLGRRTGHERRPEEVPARRTGEENMLPRPVQPLPQLRPAPSNLPPVAAPGTPLARALDDIASADRRFDAHEFLAGARNAHEMIVTAFAENDKASLKPYVDRPIFDTFASAIDERHAKGWSSDFTYVRLKSAEVVDAALRGRTAEITVRFVCELMTGLRDAAGEVVEGDPAVVRQVTDIWTFARDTRASDPNWQLVATSAEAGAA
ncbi:MAG: Tim44/TimA family putative adaptor protein [Alphaproteobacteria bacterium]|nr:Tim44/TimA family putative adaptor protein [Alphaproteobacteria bacterium]